MDGMDGIEDEDDDQDDYDWALDGLEWFLGNKYLLAKCRGYGLLGRCRHFCGFQPGHECWRRRFESVMADG